MGEDVLLAPNGSSKQGRTQSCIRGNIRHDQEKTQYHIKMITIISAQTMDLTGSEFHVS